MERVIEIVNYLMKQVYTHGENSYNERDLVDSLVQLGYSPEEIHVAFKLLQSFPGSVKNAWEESVETLGAREGFRIFSPDEQKKLSIACQGQIIQLMHSSLLSLAELEKILLEALQTDAGEIGLKELTMIIHRVIGDQERLLMISPPRPTEGNPTFLLN
jgi:uncharacterized protein Smg (DUF494 family)